MKIRRGLTVKQATKREILCKQIELLAEGSVKSGRLARDSEVIARLNQELDKPLMIMFLTIALTNFFICYPILLKKILRG